MRWYDTQLSQFLGDLASADAQVVRTRFGLAHQTVADFDNQVSHPLWRLVP